MYKKIIIIAGTIIVLCLLAIAVFAGISLSGQKSTEETAQPQKQAQITPATVCSNDSIVTASHAIAASDLGALSQSYKQISAMNNYQNDPNCQYIVVRYYLASGQVDKASAAIDQLQRVLSAGGQYSTAFTPPTVSITDLRATLATERSQQTNSTQSSQSVNLTDIDNQYVQQKK